jgi:hypothetical protein
VYWAVIEKPRKSRLRVFQATAGLTRSAHLTVDSLTELLMDIAPRATIAWRRAVDGGMGQRSDGQTVW